MCRVSEHALPAAVGSRAAMNCVLGYDINDLDAILKYDSLYTGHAMTEMQIFVES